MRKPISNFGKYSEPLLGVVFRTSTLNIDCLDIDDYTKAFLKALQQQQHTDPLEINTSLTAAEVRANYKNWRENTSTSPVDQHLGLYKTWTNVLEEKEDNYDGL
eukprot:2902972-Ditylum_brightwellii.AAC.1